MNKRDTEYKINIKVIAPLYPSVAIREPANNGPAILPKVLVIISRDIAVDIFSDLATSCIEVRLAAKSMV